MRVKLSGFICERCNHEWIPRQYYTDPIICPACKIEQCSNGARITVHGDDMSDVVNDYCSLRTELRIAPFISVREV